MAFGQEGFYTCCGGEVYSNGHKADCFSRPDCCGKCRFGCLLEKNAKARGEIWPPVNTTS